MSLHQPWASLVACGLKTIETRGKRTNHRGPLLIVASKTVALWDPFDCMDPDESISEDIARHDVHEQYLAGKLPAGVSVCIVEVVGCRPMTEADEVAACCPVYPGAWAWITDKSKLTQVDEVPVRGWPGLFEGPDFYTGRLTI